jgi:hypothetical protein
MAVAVFLPGGKHCVSQRSVGIFRSQLRTMNRACT